MSSAPLLADFYHDILPDREAFLEAGSRPLPTTLWANPLRLTPEALRRLCAEEGIDLEPLPWHPGAFRYDGEAGIGRRWEYLTGLLQVQEEVSMLPGLLIDARPGERVLDLCAAPGNKTAQMAAAMANRGTLIANDRDAGRIRAFGQISKRLGLLNVSTTVYDGTKLPERIPHFDRVLVDVPCSCEGTFRKDLRRTIRPSIDYSQSLAHTQRRLLEKAMRLCRPGGRVVYATCTFSPLENEGVVSDALEAVGGGWRVVPVRVEGLETHPGLTNWRALRFREELEGALRVWPGRSDTGGFFVVVLEREPERTGECDGIERAGGPSGEGTVGEHPEATGNAAGEGTVGEHPGATGNAAGEGTVGEHPEEAGIDAGEPAPDPELEAHIQAQCDRFGIPREVLDCRFLRTGNEGIRAVSVDHHPPARLRIDAAGLLAIKTDFRYPKLTTAAAMHFGRFATRNRVDLTREQRDALLRQDNITVTEAQAAGCSDMGYVLLYYAGVCLGAGLYFPEPRAIRSLFPRYFLGA